MPTKTKYELKKGVATRKAFGDALLELGRKDERVVVCDADISKSTMTHMFHSEFPERFFSCGIAEANMVAIGAGLAAGRGMCSARFMAAAARRSHRKTATAIT